MQYRSCRFLVLLWYGSNLLFVVGMKRLDFCGRIRTHHNAAPCKRNCNVTIAALYKQPHRPSRRMHTRPYSFLLGTICTNISLALLTGSFVQVVKTTEPLFAVALCACIFGEQPGWLSLIALTSTVLGLLITTHASRGHTFSLTGLVTGVGANLFLQTRLVVNKSMLSRLGAQAAKASTAPTITTSTSPWPSQLLLTSVCLALPLQLLLHAAVLASASSPPWDHGRPTSQRRASQAARSWAPPVKRGRSPGGCL